MTGAMMNELNIVARAVQGSSSALPVRLSVYLFTASSSIISMAYRSIEVMAIRPSRKKRVSMLC